MSHIYTPPYDFITGITKSQAAEVTFQNPVRYLPGEYLSFRVSKPYGMTQMNNIKGRVLFATAYTVTVDIDTTDFDAFIIPSSPGAQPAMAVPAGSGILPDPLDVSKAFMPARVILDDAFDNRPVT